MRGKPRQVQSSGTPVRIIPARAGQTRTTGRPSPPATDHPRACGANLTGGRPDDTVGGSSPRVRGKLGSGALNELNERIIPARAGQTIQASAPEAYAPDHPRACGANWLTSDMLGCRVGSSPRVRGKRPVEHVRGSHTRIIPARAGQTTGAVVVAAHNADHPRACGANRLLAYATRWAAGSSPRVRGKRSKAGDKAKKSTDHPRACGANTTQPRHP